MSKPDALEMLRLRAEIGCRAKDVRDIITALESESEHNIRALDAANGSASHNANSYERLKEQVESERRERAEKLNSYDTENLRSANEFYQSRYREHKARIASLEWEITEIHRERAERDALLRVQLGDIQSSLLDDEARLDAPLTNAIRMLAGGSLGLVLTPDYGDDASVCLCGEPAAPGCDTCSPAGCESLA